METFEGSRSLLYWGRKTDGLPRYFQELPLLPAYFDHNAPVTTPQAWLEHARGLEIHKMGNYGLSATDGRDIVIVMVVLGFLAILSTILRVVSRRMRGIKLGWDDNLMIIATV